MPSYLAEETETGQDLCVPVMSNQKKQYGVKSIFFNNSKESEDKLSYETLPYDKKDLMSSMKEMK